MRSATPREPRPDEAPARPDQELAESAACRRIRAALWDGEHPFCPRCGRLNAYALKSGRYRCGGCGYTFQDHTGRWINNAGLSCRNWLALVELFAREASAREIASRLHVAYNTAHRAVTTLRFAILAQALDARQMLGPATGLAACLKGAKLAKHLPAEQSPKVPVFGILERSGWAFADLVPELTPENVLHFHSNFQLPLVRRGNLVYSAPYRHYQALVFCPGGSMPTPFLKRPGRTKDTPLSADVQGPGFWPFALPRLTRYKGVSPRLFPLYLKELEFRYNLRDQDMASVLLGRLCAFVPKVEHTDSV